MRQSEVFFPLAILLFTMLSHQAFVLVLSRIIQIFDRAIVISDKVWGTLTLFASPFWFLRNIALPATTFNPIHQGQSIRPPPQRSNECACLSHACAIECAWEWVASFLPHGMTQVMLWGLGFGGEIQLKITLSLC